MFYRVKDSLVNGEYIVQVDNVSKELLHSADTDVKQNIANGKQYFRVWLSDSRQITAAEDYIDIDLQFRFPERVK
jgi:hypothetical protein